jgi:hypothetical protein
MTDEESPGERLGEPPSEPAGEPVVNGDTKATQRKARGKRRMRQLAQSNEAVRAQLEADILDEIGGGTPSVLHRVAAEAMAAAIVAGRKMRAKGQSDADAVRQIAQIARAFGLKPAPNAPAAPLTIADQLRLRGYAPPAPASSPTTDTDDEDGEE